MAKLRAEMKRQSSVGDELTVSETRELTNWNGYWNANADIRFFKLYYEEVNHERYDDILHMTQGSKNALPNIANCQNDWEQERNLSKDAK